MDYRSKFNHDDVVFGKVSGGGVVRGAVQSIGLHSPKGGEVAFYYLVWVSDRRDNAGHHMRFKEENLGASFDEAYFEARSKLPWNLMDDIKKKDFQEFFAKDAL